MEELYERSETEDLKRGSADKAVGARSSWQSEKVEIQRKESRNYSNRFLTLCSCREMGGANTRRAREPVIRSGRGGTTSYICLLQALLGSCFFTLQSESHGFKFEFFS